MRLTRRGVAVLVAAVCAYALGELAGYPFFRILAGIALGALLAAAGLTLFRPKIEVSRIVQPDRIERGRPALASLMVRNPTARRHGGFVAVDRAGAETRQLSIRSLAAGAEAAYHYELPTGSRGRFPVGPLALHRLDPFDLVRSTLTMGTHADLWVHPKRHPVRPARAGHPRHHHDGPIDDPPLRGSADLRAVREYVVGDEVRLLHWKATARTGQLMVREYADPAQLKFTVVLDTRQAAMSAAQFEDAVEVAASLLYASVSAGQRCRLVTPTGTDLAVSGGLRMARTLLDELCVVGQQDATGAPLVPAPLAGTRPGGALAVITGPATELGPAGQWRPDTVIRLGAEGAAGTGRIHAMDAEAAVAGWNAIRAGRA